MTNYSIEALRLQLLANGYSLTRNHDKRTFQKGWPTTVVDEVEIARWSRRFSRDRGTGIKVCDGLAVIDLDINDKALVTRIANAIFDAVPVLADPATPLLVRRGKGFKEAWFVATDETFSRIHSRAWLAPGTVADDGAHRVEIFGGGSPRQFGSFGPHTLSDDGTVLVEYAWVDQSPADVPLDALPVLTKKDFFAIADIVERELEAAGWSIVPRSTKGENEASRVFDLNDEMEFDTNTGEHLTLELMRALAASYPEGVPPLRCAANFIEGPDAKRTDRCIVSLTASGHLAVWESASGVTHVEAAAKPKDYGPEINRIAEKLKELEQRRKRSVKPSDTFEMAVAKMLDMYAFCPNQQNDVIPLWSSSPDDGKQMSKLRLEMLRNAEVEVGPRGGRRTVNPVDSWISNERLVVVHGVRMRADQPRPTFEESGRTYVNCYDPPLHVADGGDAALGLQLFDHLLPDETERAWFMDWLSFKLRHPHIPGPAVVMVAHKTFGTGRGTLGALLGLLMGTAYVRNIDFASFTGKTYQSQYNEWQADALMVIVNESAETVDGSRFTTKQNTYEHLKELVEVRPTLREIRVKRERNFRAVSSTSFLIATNHADALPIPEHDRRFCVLRNGGTKPVEWWDELNAWMEDPANVAALYDVLVARDTGSYSPFAPPPVFSGKQRMMDEATSDIDRAFAIALDSLQSPFFVADQIEQMMRQVEKTHDLDIPRDVNLKALVKRLLRRDGFRIGERHGHNWLPAIDGKRYAAYAVSETEAARGTKADASWLRDQILLNGKPGGGGTVVALALERLKKGDS